MSVIRCDNTVFAQHENSLSSQALLGMCLPPSCNVSGVGSEMSDDEEAQYNLWHKNAGTLHIPGSCPALPFDLEDWEICRVDLSCHFALDVIFSFTV